MPASIVGTYSVPATSSSNAASVAATRALYGLMVRNNSLIRTFPSRPPPRPDICTSSQYQSYLNNWASRVATNVSICVGPPIGRGGGGGRYGRDLPGCRRMANLDHFQTVFSRKTVGKCQAPAAWQISTVLGGPTGGSPPERNPPEGSPTEGNPTEERGRRRRPLQV